MKVRAALVLLVLLAPSALAASDPVAFFSLSAARVSSGRDVTADATLSEPSDGAGNITEYAWRWSAAENFTVGNESERHAYPAAGVHVVTLRITDAAGKIAFANQSVLVTGAAPSAYFTYTAREERGGLVVEVDARFSEPSRGADRIVTYEWSWGDAEEGARFLAGNATDSHFYAAPGTYRIDLRVTDDQGRSDTEGQQIQVKSTFWTRLRVVGTNWEGFLLGAKVTLQLAVVSTVVGFVLAVALALLRISRFKLVSLPALAYIEVIRGTPLFVQILVSYLVLPEIGIKLSIFNAGLLALIVNTSAYQAEAIRAGIQAIPTGQMEAAVSLGMTYPQAMRRIIIPQAFRLTLPALGNEFIILLKDTSLVSVIGLIELTKAGQFLANRTFIVVETFLVVAAIYFVMTYTLSYGLRKLEKRLAVPGLGLGAHA